MAVSKLEYEIPVSRLLELRPVSGRTLSHEFVAMAMQAHGVHTVLDYEIAVPYGSCAFVVTLTIDDPHAYKAGGPRPTGQRYTLADVVDDWTEGNPPQLRADIQAFGRLMEHVMGLHDEEKGGYDETNLLWLQAKLAEETGELGRRLVDMHDCGAGDYRTEPAAESAYMVTMDTIHEAVDVANVAMMLAHNLAGKLWHKFHRLAGEQEEG